MVEPYSAVALQTSVRTVNERSQVEQNLDHIANMIDLSMHMCSLELPVRLIALGEGAIQGFVDEVLDMGQAEYTETMAADLPGWETEFLGEKARQYGIHIIAQLKAKMADFPGRYFNTVFIVDPDGKIIYKHRKNVVLFVEHSTTPHDVYDEWVAKYGDTLDAFFPVARTAIGNIAGSVGVEGAFPESYRAFAMNGAEILYRASLPEPWVSRGTFEIQNRSRAIDNTCYMIAPNTGSLISPATDGGPSTTIGGALGGHSSIVDYKGGVMGRSDVVDDCYVSAEINVDALRNYREQARIQNWIPYLRTEIYRKLYETAIWPKNQPPMHHADAEKVFNQAVSDLKKRGVYTARS